MTYEWNKVYNGLPQSCVRDDPFDVCGKDFTKLHKDITGCMQTSWTINVSLSNDEVQRLKNLNIYIF